MFNIINLILFIISTILLIFIIKKENFLKIVNDKYNNLLESIGIKTEETIIDNNFFKPFRSKYFFYISHFLISITLLYTKDDYFIILSIIMIITIFTNFYFTLFHLSYMIKSKTEQIDSINEFYNLK